MMRSCRFRKAFRSENLNDRRLPQPSVARCGDMPEGIERVGSSLLNLVLGGVILWVGQTTFRHSGILASVDEKFQSVNEKFSDVDRREEDLRKCLDSAVADWKDTTRYLFTTKDGDKVVTQVRQVELSSTDL